METAQPLPAYYRLKQRLLADIEAGHYGMVGNAFALSGAVKG